LLIFKQGIFDDEVKVITLCRVFW